MPKSDFAFESEHAVFDFFEDVSRTHEKASVALPTSFRNYLRVDLQVEFYQFYISSH